LLLADKFGIDMEGKRTKTTFLVKELGYNDEMIKELERFKQPKTKTQTSVKTDKPWWKIW
jgi:hypothetical protein